MTVLRRREPRRGKRKEEEEEEEEELDSRKLPGGVDEDLMESGRAAGAVGRKKNFVRWGARVESDGGQAGRKRRAAVAEVVQEEEYESRQKVLP